MFKTKENSKVAMYLALSYIIVYALDKIVFNGALYRIGSGKNFLDMEVYEWYRIITSSFLHLNAFHLLVNIFGIYFVSNILENRIGSQNFLIIYIIGNISSNVALSILSNFNGGIGPSPGIYALIACIIIIHFKNNRLLNLRIEKWRVNYIIIYFLLGNIVGIFGVVGHIFGFAFGLIASLIYKTPYSDVQMES